MRKKSWDLGRGEDKEASRSYTEASQWRAMRSFRRRCYGIGNSWLPAHDQGV
jgi:hypothetical protein